MRSIFLQSTPLIRSVVEEMDLQVSYYLQEDKIPKELEFSMKDLYEESPFIVIPERTIFNQSSLFLYQYSDEESCQISALSSDATIVEFQ